MGKSTKFVGLFFLLLGLTGTLFGNGYTADAAAVKVDPNTTEITAENNFIIPKNPTTVKTSVSVNGSHDLKKYKANESPSYDLPAEWEGYAHANYLSRMNLRPNAFQKEYAFTSIGLKDLKSSDTITVDYGAIGIYQGKPANVQLKLSNIKVFNKDNFEGTSWTWDRMTIKDGLIEDGKRAVISVSDNLFSGIYYYGVQSMSAQLIVTDEQGQPINFSGDTFIGFNSLNPVNIVKNGDGDYYKTSGAEGVSYEKMDSSEYYVTKDSILREYNSDYTKNGKVVMGNIAYNNNNGVISPNAASATFNSSYDKLGHEKFTQATVSFKISGTNPTFQLVTGRYSVWTAFSSATLFNVKPAAPKKQVTDSNDKDINGNEIFEGVTYKYKVSQKVHQLGVDRLQRYSLFSMSDKMDTRAEFKNAYVLNDEGKKVDSSSATIKHDAKTNTVTYTASEKWLEEMPLDGETYTLVIEWTPKFGENVTDLKNTATVKIDNNTNNTNEVTNKPKVPIISEPTKKVLNEAGEEINEKPLMAGEKIEYAIDQQVNELNVDIGTKYSKFKIEDTLSNYLHFDRAEVLRDGEVIEDAKEISFDEESNTLVFDGDKDFLNAMPMKKETYTLKIYATVINEIGFDKLIENQAKVTINDTENPTNKVENPTKLPIGSITVNKVTDQLIGVKTDVETSEDEKQVGLVGSVLNTLFPMMEAHADELTATGLVNLIYGEKPQEGVTYRLEPAEDVKYPDGELVHEKGEDLGKSTTGQDGKATFDGLSEGTYYLIEVSAPRGIQVDPEPILVPLKAENNGQEIVVADANHKDPLQEVKISGEKVFETEDGKFEAGEGATFGLFTATNRVVDEENTVKKDSKVAEMTVDKEGKFGYQGVLVPDSWYYVQELTTREGYQLNNEKMYFYYEPVNSEAVHEINLYNEGYEVEGKFIPYAEAVNLVSDSQTPSAEETDTSDTSTESTEDSQVESTEESSEATESTTEAEKPTEDEVSVADYQSIASGFSAVEKEQQEPIKNWIIKENSIVKSIVRKDGSKVDHYDLVEDKESITFEGTIYVGDNVAGTKIAASDKLPEGFSYQIMNLYDEKGEDVTDQITNKIDGQNVSMEVKQEYADTLKRTTLRWVVTTTYNHSKDHEDETFENVMNLQIGDHESKSNVVTLKPFKLPEEIQKEEKPSGVFPNTGSKVAFWSFVGLALIGNVVFFKVRSKF